MQYKLERFRDAKHLDDHNRDPLSTKPYRTAWAEFDSQEELVERLKEERLGDNGNAVYRVTPMGSPFLVEVVVERRAQAWVTP